MERDATSTSGWRALRLLFLIAVVRTASGCGVSTTLEATPSPKAGEAQDKSDSAEIVALRFEEEARTGELTLRWLELKDSRCPRGASCVWEGEVTVVLEITREGRAADELALTLRPGREGSPSTAAGHEFRLRRVEPWPVEGKTPTKDELVAEIELTVVQGPVEGTLRDFSRRLDTRTGA